MKLADQGSMVRFEISPGLELGFITEQIPPLQYVV